MAAARAAIISAVGLQRCVLVGAAVANGAAVIIAVILRVFTTVMIFRAVARL